jgi:flagellar protein FlbD
MIVLHKLNGDEFALNPNHIEVIEARPDSTITLSNEKKYLVRETVEEIIEKIREYNRSINIRVGKSISGDDQPS